MKTRSFSASMALFLALVLLFGMSQDTIAQNYSEGDIVPDFTLNNMDNIPVNLYDFEGQVILLNFFAHW